MARSKSPTTVLPETLQSALLHALPPAAMAAPRQEAVKKRLLSRISTDQLNRQATGTNQVPLVRAGQGIWTPLGQGVAMQILLDDSNGRSMLLKMQAGGRLPAHDHPGDEECLVLEGSCFLGELRMRRGDYQHAGQGTRHGEVTSPDGCLLFIRSTKPRRNVDTRVAGMP